MELPEKTYQQISELSDQGNTYADAGDFSKSIQTWSRALSLLPAPLNNWEAYTWLSASIGDAHFQLGQIESAQEKFFNALNGPDGLENPFIYYRLGQCQIQLNDEHKGTESLLRAYMLDPQIFKDDPHGEALLQKLKHKGIIT